MTDAIDFPLTLDTPHRRTVRFVILDSLDQLPAEPGLFVLMGGGPGKAPRPLAFGHVAGNLARQLPQRPEFASALRDGLAFVAIARPEPGSDPDRTAEMLGRTHRAPINEVQAALRDIEAAQRPPLATTSGAPDTPALAHLAEPSIPAE